MTDAEKIAALIKERDRLRCRLAAHEDVASHFFDRDLSDLRPMVERHVPAHLQHLVMQMLGMAHNAGEVRGRTWAPPPLVLVPREP